MSSLPSQPAPGYKVRGRFLYPLKGREALHVTRAANAVGLLWMKNLHLGSVKRGLAVPAEIESPIGKVRFPARHCWPKVIIKATLATYPGDASPTHAQYAFRTFCAREAEEWYRGRDIYPQTPAADDVPACSSISRHLVWRKTYRRLE